MCKISNYVHPTDIKLSTLCSKPTIGDSSTTSPLTWQKTQNCFHPTATTNAILIPTPSRAPLPSTEDPHLPKEPQIPEKDTRSLNRNRAICMKLEKIGLLAERELVRPQVSREVLIRECLETKIHIFLTIISNKLRKYFLEVTNLSTKRNLKTTVRPITADTNPITGATETTRTEETTDKRWILSTGPRRIPHNSWNLRARTRESEGQRKADLKHCRRWVWTSRS